MTAKVVASYYTAPDESSILVAVSMRLLRPPAKKAFSGTMVGAAINPAVIIARRSILQKEGVAGCGFKMLLTLQFG